MAEETTTTGTASSCGDAEDLARTLDQVASVLKRAEKAAKLMAQQAEPGDADAFGSTFQKIYQAHSYTLSALAVMRDAAEGTFRREEQVYQDASGGRFVRVYLPAGQVDSDYLVTGSTSDDQHRAEATVRAPDADEAMERAADLGLVAHPARASRLVMPGSGASIDPVEAAALDADAADRAACDALPATDPTAILTAGDRVRTLRTVDRWPHAAVLAGAEGTVTICDETPSGYLVCVKFDEPVPGLEAWDNEVQWFDDLIAELPADLDVL